MYACDIAYNVLDRGYEMYYHDLMVISSNPIWIELGVHNTSVLSCT